MNSITKRVEAGAKYLDLACIIPYRNIDDTNLCEEVGDQHASYSKNCPPSILKLCLHIPFEVDMILSQAKGDEAIVINKVFVKVSKGC
ncbi:hypothetical protein GOP47_0004832 [Adiantum capillus-veneris]|uniref:Uncharacterized protein n=1 Tax=Adiantum capillus-veneris TaxID=13818 RepID=A0A9D4V506_ADICA|nr:hypothetical protein GOP47_0004832 [Adiantum capillus-veneris]